MHAHLSLDNAEHTLYQLVDGLRDFLNEFEDPSPLSPDEAEALWRHTHAVAALSLAMTQAHYADRLPRGRDGASPSPEPSPIPLRPQERGAAVGA